MGGRYGAVAMVKILENVELQPRAASNEAVDIGERLWFKVFNGCHSWQEVAMGVCIASKKKQCLILRLSDLPAQGKTPKSRV
jgi:hypothetical protein